MHNPAIGPIDIFQFKTTPYKHQLEALKRSCFLEFYAYLMDMGTGKSKVIIDNFCILFENRKITSVVIIAPKSVYRNWIIRELPKHIPNHILSLTRIWIHGQKNVEKLNNAVFEENGFYLDIRGQQEDLVEFLDEEHHLNILVVNVEAFSGIYSKMFHIIQQYLKSTPTLVVIDESTTIRNFKSQRTKSIIKLRDSAKYRRIATGLLTPNGPQNAFPQFQFLKDGCLGTTSPIAFRARYCQTVPVGIGMRQVEKVVGTKNLEDLKYRISKHSYRKTKEECLDLPGKTWDWIYSDLDDVSRELYEQMKKNAFIELAADSGESIFVQTQNRINMLMRLQRITCGHIQDETGRIQRFSSKRIEDTVEYLSFIQGSVLIWSIFTQDVLDLVAAIRKEYGETSCMPFHGGTAESDRDEAITKFQKKQLPYLVLNQATGRFGNTLTASSTAIYYSNSADLEHRNQSEDRIYRIGQNSHCLYLDVNAPNTVNYGMATSLRKKINLAGEVMGDKWRKWLV